MGQPGERPGEGLADGSHKGSSTVDKWKQEKYLDWNWYPSSLRAVKMQIQHTA